MVVLLASVFNLLPVGFVVGLFVSHPLARLLLTLVVGFVVTFGLVQILRRRFLNLFLAQQLELRSTLRSPGQRTTAAMQELTNHGFSPVDTVVVTVGDGTTLTRPIVVMSRHLDGQVAQATSIGAAVLTLLNDGTWLVTSSAPIVAHPTLRVHRVGKWETREAVEQHTIRLRSLADSGLEPGVQPAPLDTVLHLERLEQETLAAFRSGGVSAPSAKALTKAGAP